MAKISENPVAAKVAKIAEGFGYKATIDHSAPEFRIFGWFPGRKFRPRHYREAQ